VIIRKILILSMALALIFSWTSICGAQETPTPQGFTRNIIDNGGNPVWTPADAINNFAPGDFISGNNTAGYTVIVVFKNSSNDTIPPIYSHPHSSSYQMQIPGNAIQAWVKKDGTVGPGSSLALSGGQRYGPSLSTYGVFILVGLLLIMTIYIYQRKKAESAG
jgi:hypothetical protein